MIAIVVDEYEDAVDYFRIPNHPEAVFVVCRVPEDVPKQVNAIAYLGGSDEVRAAALAALAV